MENLFNARFEFLYARFLSRGAGYNTLMSMITKENKIELNYELNILY